VSAAEGAESLGQLFATLQRYAGWLDRERTCGLVRADVKALGAAIETRADPSSLLQALDANIARLPSGALRKMLRVTAGQVRHALISAVPGDAGGADPTEGRHHVE
jgi:hypothetical protein